MDNPTCAVAHCDRPQASEVACEVPLCLSHFRYSHEMWLLYLDTCQLDTPAGVAPEDLTRTCRLITEGESVVYYIAMNGRVKIGTTANLARRLRGLYAQPEDVLAIEMGDRTLEASRHQQFAHYRVPGTELFDRCGVLDELIDDLRRRVPDPVKAAAKLNGGSRERIDLTNEELFAGELEPANQSVVW